MILTYQIYQNIHFDKFDKNRKLLHYKWGLIILNLKHIARLVIYQ